MSRLEARALLDDGMKAFASLLKLKKLTPTNASHIFRRRLDKGVKKEELPLATAPKERIQADDNRRNGVLDTLLRGLVTELETPGAEGSLVPENYTAALHNSLTTILASKETMAMLSSRNHSIRIDGNDSAHAAHSVESLTLMQVVMCGLGLGLKAPAWALKPRLRPTNITSRAVSPQDGLARPGSGLSPGFGHVCRALC